MKSTRWFGVAGDSAPFYQQKNQYIYLTIFEMLLYTERCGPG
jgi:hypothetical protein